jgi:hypothetical protein
MASAPRLTPWEFVWLALLHEAVGLLHLTLRHSLADSVFAVLLLSLMVSLAGRVVRFRKQPPPPQMLLALTGLLCGATGSMLSVRPATLSDPSLFRLSSLLLYQGLLLPPVLGVGSFIFPRILGGGFGEPSTQGAKRAALIHAMLAALAIVASFFIEAFGSPMAGGLIRAGAIIIYLIAEIPWRIRGSEPKGSFVPALYAALLSGVMGLISASLFDLQRIALDHLLYIGGFGLLIVVVASRVLFGHGGQLADFQRRSKMVRWLWGLTLLAALTRVTPGFLPQLAISHYQYAALTWSVVMLLWLGWHRRRFAQRDDE